MYSQWVQFFEFRNYRTCSYFPASHRNILTGLHAQEKIYLLEDLLIPLASRTFWPPRLSEVPGGAAWGEGAP